MRPSIKHHVFRQFIILSLLIIITLTVQVMELMFDEDEENKATLEAKLEQSYYAQQISDKEQTWETATTLVTFVPKHLTEQIELPNTFQGLPVPFSGEVDVLGNEYWVDVSQSEAGVLYFAKDMSGFEQREEILILVLVLSGLLYIAVSYISAQLSTRRVVGPLAKLTQEISNISPLQRTQGVSEDYEDQELYSIATTFNSYLRTIEEYVKREKMLIGMASHELRTPIAVISGALDVLEERATMSVENKKTVDRIRAATNEMDANIVAILLLARKQPESRQVTRVSLSRPLNSAVLERLNSHPGDQARLSILPSEIDHEVVSDLTLINMLLRNLIQNSLEHTQGKVTLQQNEQGLLIMDEGGGLPKSIGSQLEQEIPSKYVNKSGLGLFIVTLICENLGWKIEVDEKNKIGLKLQLYI